MDIKFFPIRMDASLSLSKAGDVLTINGEDFDFSVMPADSTLPQGSVLSMFIAGDVTRNSDGVLTLPLLLPHGPDPIEAIAYPAALTDIPDGVIALPTDEVEEAPTDETLEPEPADEALEPEPEPADETLEPEPTEDPASE